MATRVKKLAREMGTTPAQVLGYLHAVGYVRYKSPQDMLPDAAVDKVRRAARDGIDAPALELNSGPSRVAAPVAAPAEDLMSELIPGVVKTRGGSRASTPPRAKSAPAPAATVPVGPAPQSASQRLAVQELEARLAVAQAELAAAQAALIAKQAIVSADAQSVDVWRQQLNRERTALDADRAAFELERAAFEQARAAVVAQQQAADEAEVAKQLDGQISELSALLMLNGLRRVVIVGGSPTELKALRAGIDTRVELRFAAGSRGRAEAEADVSRTDAIVLWDVTVNDEAQTVYQGSRATVVTADGSLSAVVDTTIAALRDDGL